MNEPIVVFGGSGRLGRRFRQMAKEEGRRVVNIDPREPAELSLSNLERFEWVCLAAQICVETNNEGLNSLESLLETNMMAPARFFAAHRSRISRAVFASSLEVYGDSHDGQPIREEAPLRPVTAYGISKLMGEMAIRLHCEDAGISCVILRYASLYGAQDDLPNALVTMLSKATADETIEIQGDGSSTRSYLHLDDAARLIGAALRYPGSGVFNAAHPEPVSMRQLAEFALTVTGRGSIRFVQSDASTTHRALDASRLKLLPFHPAIDLAQGMRLRLELER